MGLADSAAVQFDYTVKFLGGDFVFRSGCYPAARRRFSDFIARFSRIGSGAYCRTYRCDFSGDDVDSRANADLCAQTYGDPGCARTARRMDVFFNAAIYDKYFYDDRPHNAVIC